MTRVRHLRRLATSSVLLGLAVLSTACIVRPHRWGREAWVYSRDLVLFDGCAALLEDVTCAWRGFVRGEP